MRDHLNRATGLATVFQIAKFDWQHQVALFENPPHMLMTLRDTTEDHR